MASDRPIPDLTIADMEAHTKGRGLARACSQRSHRSTAGTWGRAGEAT
jgi:hypothetical protein